jgi:CubicO group peptidase (beta-lactamase class C family)
MTSIMRPVRLFALVVCGALSLAPAMRPADGLPADVRSQIDAAAGDVLSKTGAPSASIAIVRGGKIVYANAYGDATLDPKTAATTDMRYSIGSISKQFTAAAILMLAEEGKLSLDDPVSRWLPDLTRARDVTVRQVLSMTSGYQDFWPQDYVMPPMLEPVTAAAILEQWGRKPLDFEPGTQWQYSNTNYVIAGVIVHKAAGRPLMDLLRERVFGRLGMDSVFDTDRGPLGTGQPTRYRRFALGPLRPAPKEGPGWMFAAGELAMTASDLARWDISMTDGAILRPESYRAMETEVQLKNGAGTGYGLGVFVTMSGGRRRISHDGEVSGFTAANYVYPDDRTAVVALVNLDATGAPSAIASRIASTLFGQRDVSASSASLEQAKQIFEGLQHGRIDRALFTSNANAYFDAQALADFSSSLGPLGTPKEFTEQAHFLRGGMTGRRFRIRFADVTLALTTYTMPDGLLEQYQVFAVE